MVTRQDREVVSAISLFPLISLRNVVHNNLVRLMCMYDTRGTSLLATGVKKKRLVLHHQHECNKQRLTKTQHLTKQAR